MKTRTFKLLLVVIIATLAIGLQSKAQEKKAEKLYIVENMPEYPRGNKALIKDIKSLVSYPKQAIESGLIGKVYASFVVTKDGKTKNSSIARGVDPVLDKEALRVINQLQKTWKPGIQDGKPVDVNITVLFDFKEDGKINVTLPPGKK